MRKWVTLAFLAALLVGAGYFYGIACRQLDGAYELILSPSRDLLTLLLWFLLAVLCLAVPAGLVAALVRPVWLAALAFALSGIALFLSWGISVVSGATALVYVAVGSFYVAEAAKELAQRITFSASSVTGPQGMLVIALIIVACGSVYAGAAARIEREGFYIPSVYVDALAEQMEKQIAAQVPEEERQEAVATFRREFRRTVEDFYEQTLRPYERYIAWAIAAGLFMPLVTLTRLLGWVPTILLSVIFPALKVIGIIADVTETREVHRLIIA